MCPKCGREGTVRVVRQRKRQGEYRYVVIDHQFTTHAVDRDSMVDIIERLLNENWELKVKVSELTKENAELKEKVKKLLEENVELKVKAEAYEEMKNHMVWILKRNVEKLEEIKNLLEEGKLDEVYVIPIKHEIRAKYVDLK